MTTCDWRKEPVSIRTVIDKPYKNTQNVRRFFYFHCGEHFKFDQDQPKDSQEALRVLKPGGSFTQWVGVYTE